MELEQIKESECRAPRHLELDVNHINIAYSCSHENYKDRGIRGRRHPIDDLSGLKI